MEEIKKFIQKVGVMRFMLVVVCGVFLLILSYSGEGEHSTTEEVNTEVASDEDGSLEKYKQAREEELKELLQKVDGVGKAEVMITLKASNEKVTLKDIEDNNNSILILIKDILKFNTNIDNG